MIRKVLAIGDIVGQPGMRSLFTNLPSLKKKHRADLTIVNAENAYNGFGLSPELASTIYSAGADVITSGNHIWEQSEIHSYLNEMPHILRPANYPSPNSGKGVCVFQSGNFSYLVINLQGRERMWNIDCPFKLADEIIRKHKKTADAIIIDFHAESPEEKESLAYYLDGRVTLVFGTHTHIQTRDHRILSKGTGYISDIGATGPEESVIGFEKDISIERSISYIPHRMKISENPARVHGLILEFDDEKPLSAISLKPFSV